MERTLVANTPKNVGQKVKIAGSVNVVRSHGKIAFIDLIDRSGIVQVVGGEDIASLKPQWAVEIEGTVKARPERMFNKKIETGEIEIEATKVKVLVKSDEMPFDMGAEDLNLELPTLLDYRALTLKHPKQREIFRVQANVARGFREVA